MPERVNNEEYRFWMVLNSEAGKQNEAQLYTSHADANSKSLQPTCKLCNKSFSEGRQTT